MFRYITILFFFGCSYKHNATQIKKQSLHGTFLSYHSAMGSGNGMLFRVTIPVEVTNNFTIDSFYLKGESHSFDIIKLEKETYVEANYYVPVPQHPAYGDKDNQKPDPETKKITDSIFIARRFYPSWIIATGNSGKHRFDILAYKEIIVETNY